MEFHHLLMAAGIGIGATLLTDLWNLFLKYSFKIQSLNFCFLGRWILYMTDGTFKHNNIKATPQKSFECLIGWFSHYCIGIALTILFILIVSVDWIIRPNFLSALIYGISTVVFPLFVMQPLMGLGLASSDTPNPALARSKSIITHIIFGVGIWLSTAAMQFALPDK